VSVTFSDQVIYRVFQKKIAQSLSTTELCRFQQNVQKEHVYMTSPVSEYGN